MHITCYNGQWFIALPDEYDGLTKKEVIEKLFIVKKETNNFLLKEQTKPKKWREYNNPIYKAVIHEGNSGGHNGAPDTINELGSKGG